MLKDIKQMIDFVKETSSILYGKEVFFYDFKEDKWYSRDHSGYVEFEEVIEWLKNRIYPYIIEKVICEECMDCKYYFNRVCDGEYYACSDYEYFLGQNK